MEGVYVELAMLSLGIRGVHIEFATVHVMLDIFLLREQEEAFKNLNVFPIISLAFRTYT